MFYGLVLYFAIGYILAFGLPKIMIQVQKRFVEGKSQECSLSE
ncbi:hypothetical protein P4H56_28395 [Bacillus cereus]|nr:hypothetical protein [Bacillus thuringiensis]MEB8829853.1 hypothetical protein [Bacillus cereus]MED2208154.1 hypothetical protein [Bacillus thuringiensis]